ncbi:MAG: 2-amino-4-hydroxy-6-hydroxymethyldihydropteridine diphosphokinase [Myxococcales bacterium]|nr:2-amino-4-hydroxy-6-hydroxymethyldihydropteridine diphosphokinase [Myxococcales bacterium]
MAPSPVKAYVALGSNLGDRQAHLEAALAALAESEAISVLRVSPIYETDPVDPAEVAGGSQQRYLNAVAEIETTLDAPTLLERLLCIEASQGRTRGPVANLARSLDLDLLLWGNSVIDLPGLAVPHPRMHQRSFVLDPLCDLVPDAVHPLLGETIATLAQRARNLDGGP